MYCSQSPCSSSSSSFPPPPTASLSCLPNELILGIYNQLQPKDRMNFGKSSRRFRDFAKAEGLLPVESVELSVNYAFQILTVEGLDDSLTYVVNATHSYAAALMESVKRISKLTNKTIIYKNVGDSWDSFVENYMKKLQRNLGQKSLGRLKICLPGTYVPEYLSQLNMRTQQLEIDQTGNKKSIELPEAMYSLMFSTFSIHAVHLLPPTLISRLSLLDITCSVDIDNAMHFIDAFTTNNLPDISMWKLRVDGSTLEFFEKLGDKYHSLRNILPIFRLEGRTHSVAIYIGKKMTIQVSKQCRTDPQKMHPWLSLSV